MAEPATVLVVSHGKTDIIGERCGPFGFWSTACA
jgi:hypothetical protein